MRRQRCGRGDRPTLCDARDVDHGVAREHVVGDRAESRARTGRGRLRVRPRRGRHRARLPAPRPRAGRAPTSSGPSPRASRAASSRAGHAEEHGAEQRERRRPVDEACLLPLRHMGERPRDAEEPRQEEVVDDHDHRGAGDPHGEEARDLEPAVQEMEVDEIGSDHAAPCHEEAGERTPPALPAADQVLAGVDRLVVVAVVDRELTDRGDDPGEPEGTEERVVHREAKDLRGVRVPEIAAIIQPAITKSVNQSAAKR